MRWGGPALVGERPNGTRIEVPLLDRDEDWVAGIAEDGAPACWPVPWGAVARVVERLAPVAPADVTWWVWP